jgi:hypothetical protein
MARISFDLTLAMVTCLNEIVSSRFAAGAIRQRAQCVLLANEDLKFVDIARRLRLTAKCVAKWVHRLVGSLEALVVVEDGQTKAALKREITDCLDDAKRSGRSKTFTPSQVASIVSIGCEDPEKSGRPVTQWTNVEITAEAIHRKIVDSISESQVRRFLILADLRPRKNKGWCFTTEKDPDLFLSQVQDVCDTYLAAPQRFAEEGIHTICVDEMTSLQANEKRSPTQRAIPGHCGKEECQYTRHGTVCLTGNWDVVAGQFVYPTIEETRNNEDFAKHIDRLIKTNLDHGWIFVVDNLNTHCGEPLVRRVARHLGISDASLGCVGEDGILKNMASRREFLSDKSHRIRFVYLPKHSSWLNQIEAIFGIVNRRVMRAASFTSKDHLMTQLKRFVEYLNATIAKPMNWTYTGRPTEKKHVETPKTWRQLGPFAGQTLAEQKPERN